MNCTATHAAGYDEAIASVPTIPAPRLELQGILSEHGRYFAAVRFGTATKMIPLELKHLESFTAFAEVLHEHDVVARHPLRSWKQAVQNAFARGAA